MENKSWPKEVIEKELLPTKILSTLGIVVSYTLWYLFCIIIFLPVLTYSVVKLFRQKSL